MEALIIILLIAGAVSFALGLAGVPARIDWTDLGLLCWILSVLLPLVLT